jgi:hypothetical protein
MRWRGYANRATLYSHTEGSPLLECAINGYILNVFERTNPYVSTPGDIEIIVNPLTEQVTKPEEPAKHLELTGLSQMKACGLVLFRGDNTVVIDAGLPLVVSVFAALPDDAAAGDWLEFTSLAPIHGFILTRTSKRIAQAGDDDI